MANRDFHTAVGMFAGGGAAFVMTREEADLAEVCLEVAGGVLAGYFGARLPDLIDPPTHPGHRSIGHGAVPAFGAAAALTRLIPKAQASLRGMAAEQRRLCQAAPADSPDAFLHGLLEALLLVASGAVAGLAGGYASHLALDALTPSGLPLVA